MITISKEYSFDSAHRLCLAEDQSEESAMSMFGKCGRLHGHTYRIRVTFIGNVNSEGMIVNYFDVNDLMKPLIDRLDHRYLNDVFAGMLTTAENMVTRIAEWLITEMRMHSVFKGVTLFSVELSETPKTNAVWSRYEAS